jgi:hypothetical protein
VDSTCYLAFHNHYVSKTGSVSVLRLEGGEGPTDLRQTVRDILSLQTQAVFGTLGDVVQRLSNDTCRIP